MKDFEQHDDSSPDAALGIVTSKKRAPSSGPDASHANAEAGALSLPQLSHPANATPLADLIGQLQQTHGNTYVQRALGEMDTLKLGAESQTGNRMQGLEAGPKSEMESAFGESFADVRVHADAAAEKMNEELGARAVTQGRDIYFGRGEYNPSTKEGKELLAHELTHVVQQRGSSISQQANTTGQVGDAFEQEADQAAALIARGDRAQVRNRSAAPSSQRQSQGELQTIRQVGPYETFSGDFHLDDFHMHTIFTPGETTDSFLIALPAGVAVSVIDLSSMNVQVRDPGGSGARTIIITASRKVEGRRLIQITFTKGKTIFVAVFHFPAVAGAKPKAGAK
jgi:Domain of unknown function (DUF4157)